MKKLSLILSILFCALLSVAQPYNGKDLKSSIPAVDTSNALVVRNVPQTINRMGFTAVTSNSVDATWGAIVGSIGSGMDVDQTGGNLILTSGTTARSETIIRSNDSWIGGIRLRARSTLSQRIVNNNFFVELVDVIGDGLTYSIGSATAITVTIPSNPFTSANVGQSMYIGGFSGTGTFLSGRYPIASVSGNDVTFTVSAFAVGTGTCSLFGWNYYQLQYTGTTATNANFDTQRKGYATGATNATINTTASPGHLAIVTGNDLVCTFADQLVATAAAIQQTVRANRNENIPDDRNLRLQIRMANGSTAPANTTTWTIGFVSVSNYALQDISVQDVRPMGVSSALPVEIMRGVSQAVTVTSGTVTSNLGTGGTGATSIGKAEDAPAASGDTGPAILLLRNDALTSNASASGDYIVPTTDLYGSQLVKRYETHARTYSASSTFTPPASATDVFTITGSATATVFVTKITISGTKTTGSQVNINLVRRSTANSAGTSTNEVEVPHISTDAAATATVLSYTANPTTGTLVGNIRNLVVPIPDAGSTNLNTMVVDFGDKGKPIVLSGIAQVLAVNLAGVTLTGISLSISVEWFEI